MQDVANRYNQNPQREWERLARSPYHTLEYLVNLQHLTAHLPPGARALDAGGGPGRYTLALARRGYRVVLLDLSEGELDLARSHIQSEPPDVQAQVEDVVAGDVADLSRFTQSAFDAVLCLDPLTYFPERGAREQVLAELVRVTVPGGLVALGVRGYLAVLRTILRVDSASLVDGSLERLQESGNTRVAGVPCHFFRAGELQSLAEGAGLATILVAGAPGLSEGLPEATNAVAGDAAKWARWQQLIVETSIDPTVVDMSAHMLYLGCKPVRVPTINL